jgi:hypothetical protein
LKRVLDPRPLTYEFAATKVDARGPDRPVAEDVARAIGGSRFLPGARPRIRQDHREFATHTSSGETADVVPETRFAWNGDVSLAYQVLGDGAMDILYVPGWLSNVDIMWESPEYET